MRARRRLAAILSLLIATALLSSCFGTSESSEKITFKILSNSATLRYATNIESSLRAAGLPVEIEQLEQNTLLDQQRKAQFQLTTGRWVGGNQDPIFLKNLFVTGANFNRGRYANSELDAVLNEAANTFDRERAKELYSKAQEIISREVPMLPLWYANQMVIARNEVENINVGMSGDWRFMRDITATGLNPLVASIESEIRFDQLGTSDASSERMRQLIYNSLVKKDENFEYVGELASNIERAPDNLSYTFTLRDGVRFHNGKPLNSADVKHTLETLLRTQTPKRGDFFEGVTGDPKLYENGYITAIETPNPKTVVVRLRQPWQHLLANLVPIGVIPEGSTIDALKERPMGTGFYKFVSYSPTQQIVELEANENYWNGAPAVKRLRVRVVGDANTLQAELKSGGVHLAVVGNLNPEDYAQLDQDPNLKVQQFPGSNVVYLNFNAEDEVFDDPRVRQAVAYAIDREAIVRDILLGQARVAHSILPEQSWAYHAGTTYSYDPAKAKSLFAEAGIKND